MYTDADVTQLLHSWSAGDLTALDGLIPLVYDDLHAMATFYFRRESETHTLQPTALVNEVYLRLFGEGNLRWENRRQFFGFASKLMRHVLVDHARGSAALKRGSDAVHLPIHEVLGLASEAEIDFVALNEVLDQLAEIDPRQSEIVSLRFIVGLTVEEISQVMSISPSTVKREWRAAKFWLYRKLTDKPANLSAATG